MNRLTKSSPLPECEAMNLSLTDLYMRLKAYEDTGLEPEEIDALFHPEKQIVYSACIGSRCIPCKPTFPECRFCEYANSDE